MCICIYVYIDICIYTYIYIYTHIARVYGKKGQSEGGAFQGDAGASLHTLFSFGVIS